MSFAGMGNNKVKFTCTALVGTNKIGVLKPDDDGYYSVVLGALNAFNSVGALYPLASAKALFEESSDLMRRISEGNCKCELGHPKPLPGQSTREFLQRILTIEETRVCAHIKEVWLEEGIKDRQGRSVVAIMGKIKPSGPYGEALKESLDNKHENVCFSIRSLTMDTMNPAGYLQKDLRRIITWDVVTEPGLSACHKYNAPSLESLQETVVLPSHLDSMENYYKKTGTGMESIDVIKSIRKSLGWDLKRVSDGNSPLSMTW